MKPIDTRILEARSRARTSHVRLYANKDLPGTYRTHSIGSVWYTLYRSPQGWVCTCPGHYYSGACKHLAALTRRSEREGWTISTIAPAPYVPDTQAAGLSETAA